MLTIRTLRPPVEPRPAEPLRSRFRSLGGMERPRILWTADRDAQLTELWGTGLSARAIAAELGGELSHNAVIGRAHRLGLHRRENPVHRS